MRKRFVFVFILTLLLFLINNVSAQFKFAVFADMQASDCTDNSYIVQQINAIASGTADFSVSVGDYIAGYSDASCFASNGSCTIEGRQGSMKYNLQPITSKTPPVGLNSAFFPGIGNHDDNWGPWYPDPCGEGICDLLNPSLYINHGNTLNVSGFWPHNLNHGNICDKTSSSTSGHGEDFYYSFSYQDSYFIILRQNQDYAGMLSCNSLPAQYSSCADWCSNTSLLLDSNRNTKCYNVYQYDWWMSELIAAQNNPAIKHIFVFLHAPLVTSSWNHPPTAGAAQFIDLMEKYNKVRMVLNGHNANYERTYPIRNNVIDNTNGIVYITTGPAGGKTDGINGAWFTASSYQNWTTYNNQQQNSGYVLISVEDNGDILIERYGITNNLQDGSLWKLGTSPSCDNDLICDIGETCSCSDCANNQDGCSSKQLCCSGSCKNTCSLDSDCNDFNSCTVDSCLSPGTGCTSSCSNTPISACINSDGCCPSGCTSLNDNNCIPSNASMNVWVQSESYKIKKTDTPLASTYIWDNIGNEINIKGARNEMVSFQIVVKSEGSDVQGVNIAPLSLTNGVSSIPQQNIEFFKEWYLNVTAPSTAMYGNPSSYGIGEYPDQLPPWNAPAPYGAPFSIKQNENQPVFVDVYIPKNAQSGDYIGTITLTSTNAPPKNINVRLNVWNFSLPDETHFKSFVYYDPRQIAWGHDLVSWDTPTYLNLEEKYMKMAHKHRIDLTTEWEDVTDWVAFDLRWGKYFDGTAFTEGPGANVGVSLWPTRMSYPQTQSTFQNFATDLMNHFISKGWQSKPFLFIFDEPSTQQEYNDIRTVGNWIDTATPPGNQLPFMLTEQIQPQNPAFGSLIGYVDIFNSPSITLSETLQRIAAGEKVWTYNGGEPGSGSQNIDTLGLAMRTWGWIAWQGKRDAWHYWDGTYFRDLFDNSWTDVWNDPVTFTDSDGDFGNGDGTIFYPGMQRVGAPGNPSVTITDGPVSSYRMKQFRRGAQDYEYMWLLKQFGQETLVNNKLAELIPLSLGDAVTPTPWSKNPDQYEAAREYLAQQILLAQGSPLPSPPTCQLTSALWSTTSTTEGNAVSLNVQGTNCDGKTISFVVWEDDLIGDDPVITNPVNAVFSGNTATGSWIAEWQDDALTDPEYYFIATLALNSTETITSSNQLTVSKSVVSSTCPDYALNGNK